MERDFYHFVENVYGSQQGAFRLSLSTASQLVLVLLGSQCSSFLVYSSIYTSEGNLCYW